MTLTFKGSQIKTFNSLINKLSNKTVGFNKITTLTDTEESLLDKINKELNKKKDD